MDLSSPDSEVIQGDVRPTSNQGFYNALAFTILQHVKKVRTIEPVQVVAVHVDGDLAPVGFVDVKPMIDQVAGDGTVQGHATIFNVPFFRLQGGTNAVIIDPVPGDIGLGFFCAKDISKIKATRSAAPPGSNRRFHYSDGIYMGGVLNGTPSQYIQFIASGIKIHSPTKVTLEGQIVDITCATFELTATTSATITTPTLALNANTSINGNFAKTGGAGTSTFDGTISATVDVISAGHSGAHHKHPYSGGTTDEPT